MWIIDTIILDDEGNNVHIHEEFMNRQDFDRRYTMLALNHDETIHWKHISK